MKPTITKSPVRSALILSHCGERPAAYGASAFLAMIPSSPSVAHLLEERFALALDVVEVPHGAELGDDCREQLLALDERQRPQVEALEREQVEREERRRELDRRAPDVER